MPVGLELGVHQPSIHRHLKTAPIGRDEGDHVDQVLEMLEQFTYQANGPVSVVSDRTVDDLNLQHTPSQI